MFIPSYFLLLNFKEFYKLFFLIKFERVLMMFILLLNFKEFYKLFSLIKFERVLMMSYR